MIERDIFIGALQKEDAGQRREFLREACGPNLALLERVEGLLRVYEGADSFLESPASSPTVTVESPSPTEAPETVIGPYKLMGPIGEGGMGIVYVAEQTQPVRRRVALKIIKPGMDSRQVVARFEAERQALAMMDHPNIARVFDGGTTPSGRPYFVMELVRGIPITDYCDRERLSIAERLELFVLVCRAVQHAHQKGVIHRDLKPSNILVTVIDGVAVPKVIDFGVAKATGASLSDRTIYTGFQQFIGTPLYMSPEQADLAGTDVDTRSDIYSLGVLLYELLTGTTPFDAETLKRAAFDEMRRIIREEEPPKPSTRLGALGEARSTLSARRGSDPRRLDRAVRGELDWVVMKALEKDRRRRYETANEFVADLMRYLSDRPVEACPPSARYRLGKFARRNRVALATAAAVTVAFALAGAGLAVGTLAAARERAKTAEAEGKVREAVAVLEPGLRQGNPHAADVVRAARQAEAHLAGDLVRPELRGQARRLLADLAMLAELERIRLDRAILRAGEFDPGTDSAYAAAFRSYGVDVDSVGPAEAGTRLRDRAIAAHLASGLDDWAILRKKRRGKEDRGWRRLLDVAGQTDPEPNGSRAAFRGALARQAPREELERLAGATPLGELPATTLHLLGNHLREAGATETAVSVLRAGQRRYPADIWLNLDLAFSLTKLRPPQLDEAIGYLRAALALRPENPQVHSNLGIVLRDKGRLDEAIACHHEALRLKPDDGCAYNNLSVALRQQGKLDEAIACSKEAVRLGPADHAEHHVNLGHNLADRGRLDEAIAAYREAIRLKPDDAMAHNNLGFALRRKGRLDEAIPCYAKAIRLQPDLALAHNNLGVVLVEKGRLDEIIAYYVDVLHLQLNALAYNALGGALGNRGRLDEAITCLREALRLRPDLAVAHSNLGAALLQQRPDEAITCLKEALRLQPGDAIAHFNLGSALNKTGRVDEAIAAWREALRLRPDLAPARAELGDALSKQGKLDEAIACYREALRLGPDDAVIHSDLGNALQQQGKPDEAIAAYREAIRLKPDYGCAYNDLGVALFGMGELDQAVTAFKEAVRLGPADHADHHNNLGFGLMLKGRMDEASASYNEALRIRPDYAPAQSLLAWLLATCYDPQIRDPARAVELARRAVTQSPEVGDYWNTLGVARYRVGEWDAAVAALEKAEALSPGANAASRGFFLAMSHWRLRRSVEARKWYDKAVARMEKDRPGDQQPHRFRAEAQALMGLAELPADVFARP
jgi:tetratricopeptide (TPR) repeat protein/tRNA A-37 threonylcarbamoyl transferase component Bud32